MDTIPGLMDIRVMIHLYDQPAGMSIKLGNGNDRRYRLFARERDRGKSSPSNHLEGIGVPKGIGTLTP
jgi:hypothetical protein